MGNASQQKTTASANDPWEADPRIGTSDVESWRAVPVDGNPEGVRTHLWCIVAGDYADEGEPDIHVEVTGEYPKDIAEFIVQAVRNEWARVRQAEQI